MFQGKTDESVQGGALQNAFPGGAWERVTTAGDLSIPASSNGYSCSCSVRIGKSEPRAGDLSIPREQRVSLILVPRLCLGMHFRRLCLVFQGKTDESVQGGALQNAFPGGAWERVTTAGGFVNPPRAATGIPAHARFGLANPNHAAGDLAIPREQATGISRTGKFDTPNNQIDYLCYLRSQPSLNRIGNSER
ncbi:hypothetical protein QUF80_05155 [Desulfococcaceae bacterium HSG8]|nr:hypothetical protein [Desulfococcaceae bacterium HSG8]